jgi:porin
MQKTGALSPVEQMLVFPQFDGSVTALTDVRLIQALGDNFRAEVGKMNLFDDIRQPLTGARVVDGFQNGSLILDMILARTLPYSTYGTGFVFSRNNQQILHLAVYDTNNTPTTSGFNTFLNNGVTLFGRLSIPTTFFDMPGHVGTLCT